MKRLRCIVGIHENQPVWDLRPETRTNIRGRGAVQCIHCARLDFDANLADKQADIAQDIVVKEFTRHGSADW